MKIFGFNGNSIVWKNSENITKHISLEFKILGFVMGDKYLVLIEDWQYLEGESNLHVYDLEGIFLFNVPSYPKALYKDSGYYSSVGFITDNIIIAQSADYACKYDLESREFISERFTK